MGPGRFWSLLTKPFRQTVGTLSDGGVVVVDARGFWKLGILAHTGATVTVHRVDSHLGQVVGTPDAGAERDAATVSANTHNALEVDWGYYHVETAGGAASWMLL